MYKEHLFKQEKEDGTAAHSYNMQKSCHKGKIIVYAIAICNIVFTLLNNLLGEFSILNIIIQMGLSLALLMGVNWVRWLFVIGSGLALFCYVCIFSYMLHTENQVPMILMVLSYLSPLQAAISGYLLVFNRSVADYFYDQKIKKS